MIIHWWKVHYIFSTTIFIAMHISNRNRISCMTTFFSLSFSILPYSFSPEFKFKFILKLNGEEKNCSKSLCEIESAQWIIWIECIKKMQCYSVAMLEFEFKHKATTTTTTSISNRAVETIQNTPDQNKNNTTTHAHEQQQREKNALTLVFIF